MAKYEESSSGAFDSEAENKNKEPVGSEAPVELWTFDSEAEN